MTILHILIVIGCLVWAANLILNTMLLFKIGLWFLPLTAINVVVCLFVAREAIKDW